MLAEKACKKPSMVIAVCISPAYVVSASFYNGLAPSIQLLRKPWIHDKMAPELFTFLSSLSLASIEYCPAAWLAFLPSHAVSCCTNQALLAFAFPCQALLLYTFPVSGSLTLRVPHLQEVSARAEQTVKELRRKADQVRRQHALELAGAEKRVREARSKKVSRPSSSSTLTLRPVCDL